MKIPLKSSTHTAMYIMSCISYNICSSTNVRYIRSGTTKYKWSRFMNCSKTKEFKKSK